MTKDRYYFIGIGGIGMSSIARFLHAHDFEVQGYDRTPSAITDQLAALGIPLCLGASPQEAKAHFDRWLDVDSSHDAIAVVTPAIPKDFLVIQAAQTAHCEVVKRSELLGRLTANHPTLAVAGTHGKTTTSALLTHLMLGTAQGCRAFLGGVLMEQGTNAVWQPDAEWTVVEADEFDRSFLHLHPEHAVITSADPDHLDVYGNPSTFLEALAAFARQVKGQVYLEQHVNIPGVDGKRFGIAASFTEAIDLFVGAWDIQQSDGKLMAQVCIDGSTYDSVVFPMPGHHNVVNALGAIALATAAGVSPEVSLERLAHFKGIERRFAYHIHSPVGVYIDDYAHHPVELEAAIAAARLHHPGRHITGIFQPHLYSRTRDHLMEFARVLGQLDRIFLLPVYAARENPIEGIDSQALFENIPSPHKHLIESNQIFDNLKANPPEVLMTLGAGDIDRVVKPLANWLNEDPRRFKHRT